MLLSGLFPPHLIRAIGLSGAVLSTLFIFAAPTAAQSPFNSFSGNWSGAGKVKFTGGSTEAVSCKAYYTPKDAGASLGVAIRCASPSSKIELRATLLYQGGKVTGKWEERTFNATGDVTGQASTNKISLSIAGGGLSGSMAVGVNGTNQSVQIKTEGIGMTGVDISLSRG